jgi:hypothetical protein
MTPFIGENAYALALRVTTCNLDFHVELSATTRFIFFEA